MTEKTAHLIDVTIRRGGFLVHNHLLKEQVATIVKGLEDSGIEFVEISHGRGLGAKRIGYPAICSDQELAKEARKAAKKIKFTAFLSPYPYSLFEVESVVDLYEYFRLSIDLDELDKGIENVKNIRKANGKVMAMLERAHRLSVSATAEAAKKLVDAGAETIYLCDNFSSMSSEDVKAYLGAIREAVPAPLGFQGYNATEQAVGNTLAALESGADWIDGSLLGLGPSGGMAPLEILAVLLVRLGYSNRLDLQELCRTGRWHALPAMRHLPQALHIDRVMSRLKLDYYPLELFHHFSEILERDVESILKEIDAENPQRLRLKESDLRDFLSHHGLDFDVVMDFIKTGKIPGVEAAS